MPFDYFETDVLVIGGGLAGATAALRAKASGVQKVALVSKNRLWKDGISTFGAGDSRPFQKMTKRACSGYMPQEMTGGSHLNPFEGCQKMNRRKLQGERK